ncbi:ABC transporter ATP-binding protein [Schleiferilactobacillus perolens]|uniref:ABC transporter ATP-binding protein n=1 Tax=Schleiferilactobacillus perolens TaxID=100468 RepID=UPI00235368B4|nr:ABC transporter ATP-binding protein [Schleiferilactobacillus perolens]MCI2171088.1 ABC transporter ATP-binding protein/permease [Schleiferilactobacillus perolens]
MVKKSVSNVSIFNRIPHFSVYIGLSFILALAVQLISLVPPLIMQRIIDQLIPAGNLRDVTISVLFFIAIPILMTAANTFYKYILAVVARRSGRALTLAAFANVLQQRMPYFDRTNSSELATFIRQETMKYVMFWLADLPQLAANVVVCLVIVGYVFHIHWLLALLLCLYFPIAFFPSNFFGRVVNGLTGRIIQANGKMAQTITDSVRSIRLVKAFQLEKKQTNTLKKALTDAVSIWSKVAFFDNLTALWITNFVNQLIIGVIFVVAAGLVIQGQMTVGGIVIVLSYLAVFYANAATILNTNYEFKKQLAEFAPLADLLQLSDGETSGDLPLTDFQRIEFDHVSFHYTAERGDILRDLSLAINRGTWVGLVGESGAGKTTIFDLLLRFYQPQKGSIEIDQTPIADYLLSALRGQITLVSQSVSIFPGTIRENLLLAKADATDAELEEVLNEVALTKFVQSLPEGLDTPVGEAGSLLSGGQQQRLSLAQGLLRHSPILLLDEISSALDSDTAEAIKEMVYRLKEQNQLTILSISHDRQFLTRCDAIYRIQNGQAIEEVV